MVMARKKSNLLDDLLKIATMLPWWVNLPLAVLSYAFLNNVSLTEIPVITQPGEVGKIVSNQLIKTFASIGQYLLPFIFVFGALLSFLNRRKRETLLANTQQRSKQGLLLDMDWREFEMLVGEAFRQRGYAITELGGNGKDGGVDIILKKEGDTYLVQCKYWKSFKIGVQIVRELYGVMAAKGAAGGYVVTSGVFTEDAQNFANGRNIELIDGNALSHLIKKPSTPAFNPNPISIETQNDISCPVCGSAMIKRVSRKGTKAGQEFLGCTRFPSCRGTRPTY